MARRVTKARTPVASRNAIPLPEMVDNTLTWKLGIAFDTSELTQITFSALIEEDAKNNTIISNSATLAYHGLEDQEFPQEQSNIVTTKVKVGSPTLLRHISGV